uniref:DUF3800 domain-containing protein n=1 Tax=candidate division WOR-3 bacterium TaxID=2052148 RepID=A0A7C4CBA2_UNCW3
MGIVLTKRTRPARYRLYLDESGDHTYNLLDDPSHRYLGLLGVWFREKDRYVEFSDALERLKRDIFGPRPDKPVVLHRTAIINRKGPFGVLCDAEVRRRFDDGLVEVVRQPKFHLACVVIDKRAHLQRYPSPFHPYHYCLAAMLDRYCGWLSYKSVVGDVMAESRGREENIQLAEAYVRTYESGTLMFHRGFHKRVLTSREIKIRAKTSNIPGLQLADVLAYPVKQTMLVERDCIAAPGDMFGRRLVEVVEAKFNRNEATGKVWGYGKIWL